MHAEKLDGLVVEPRRSLLRSRRLALLAAGIVFLLMVSWLQRAFWFALPMCLLGLICPAIIRAFVSRPKLAAAEVETKVEPPAPLSVAMPEPDLMPAPIEPQLQPTEPVVVALSSQPLEAVPAASEEEEKDYKGEYYPVARNVTPKH